MILASRANDYNFQLVTSTNCCAAVFLGKNLSLLIRACFKYSHET